MNPPKQRINVPLLNNPNKTQRITGVPIVTITNDGISKFKNVFIVPNLKLANIEK